MPFSQNPVLVMDSKFHPIEISVKFLNPNFMLISKIPKYEDESIDCNKNQNNLTRLNNFLSYAFS